MKTESPYIHDKFETTQINSQPTGSTFKYNEYPERIAKSLEKQTMCNIEIVYNWEDRIKDYSDEVKK